MKKLNKKNYKKGDKIIVITPWNHRINTERRNSVDSYNVLEWEIHSIGAKQMYLCDDEGSKGSKHRSDSDGNFFTLWADRNINMFAEKWVDVNDVIKSIRSQDIYKTPTFETVSIRCKW